MGKKKSNKGQPSRNRSNNPDEVEGESGSLGLMRGSFGAQLIGMSFETQLPSKPKKKASDGIASVTQLLKNYQNVAEEPTGMKSQSSPDSSVEVTATTINSPIAEMIHMDEGSFAAQVEVEKTTEATVTSEHSVGFVGSELSGDKDAEPAPQNEESPSSLREQEENPTRSPVEPLGNEISESKQPFLEAEQVVPVTDSHRVDSSSQHTNSQPGLVEQGLLHSSPDISTDSELAVMSLLQDRGLTTSDIARLLAQLLREDSEFVQSISIKANSKLRHFVEGQLMFVGEHLSAMTCHQINQRYLVHTTPSRCELSGGLSADVIARDLLTRFLERGIRYVAFCNVPTELHALLRHLLLHHALRVKCFQTDTFSSSAVVPSSELQLLAIWKGLGDHQLYVRTEHSGAPPVVQHLFDSTNAEYVGALQSPTIIAFLRALSEELERL